MKKFRLYYAFTFLILNGLVISPAFSMSKKADSDILKNRNRLRNEIRVDLLNRISNEYFYTSLPISYACLEQAVDLAKKINYFKGIAESYYHLGKYYQIDFDYLHGMKYSLLAYDLARAIGDKKIIGQTLNQIGSIYHIIKRDDRSVEYYYNALKAARQINDTVQIINVYINYSTLYLDSNRYVVAERYLYNALTLCLRQHYREQEAVLYKHLGAFFLRTGNDDKALYYLNKSISVNKDLKQLFHVGSIYTIIAHIYECQGDFHEALKFNKLALAYRLSYNHDEQVASSYLNIGITYLKMNQDDSASDYLLKGVSKAALYRFKKNQLLAHAYRNLYCLYKSENNEIQALKYFELYSSFQDSVSDENSKRKISVLETSHLINDKERETTELKRENFIQKLQVRNSNLLLLLLLMITLFTLAIALYIRQLLEKNRKAKKVVEEKNDLLVEEIHEQVVQNEELSRREQEYRFMTDHSADMISLMDHNFNCVYISPSCEFLSGYSSEALMKLGDYRELIHEDSRQSFDMEFASMLEFQDATRFHYQLVKKDGSAIWVESNINPIFEPMTGKLKAMLSISRDISSRVIEEEALMEDARQKEMLIREVHHRVKNNLAILTSLVNMQMGEFTDHKTRDIFSDLQFRVRAMALVHEQLYKSANIEVLPTSEYLGKLIKIVSSAFASPKVKVNQEIFDEVIDVKISLPIGLIVNELLTNAFKYAFPDNRPGTITVSYKEVPNQNSSVLLRCLTVSDDGIGLPENFSFSENTSMGSQIITLLTQQLEGKLTIESSGGASFSIILPLER
jgi:PAS domain S-box-containing protein